MASSGRSAGLPALSALSSEFGPGAGSIDVDRRAADQLAEAGRAVAARQAGAHLVARRSDRTSTPRAAAASRRWLRLTSTRAERGLRLRWRCARCAGRRAAPIAATATTRPARTARARRDAGLQRCRRTRRAAARRRSASCARRRGGCVRARRRPPAGAHRRPAARPSRRAVALRSRLSLRSSTLRSSAPPSSNSRRWLRVRQWPSPRPARHSRRGPPPRRWL